MQEFIPTKNCVLLELIMKEMNYSSTNKGRKAIKAGYVKVNGKLVVIPSTKLDKGDKVVFFDKPQPLPVQKVKNLPFVIVHEDEEILAFEKPAGLLTASPDRKRKTAFSITKAWMLGRNPALKEVFFINKLPKDASGIVVVAKNAATRVRLQGSWNRFEKKYYVIAEGQYPEDGTIGKPIKDKKIEKQIFPYRNILQGRNYGLLKVEMLKEAFSELFSSMESLGHKIPGYSRRGKANNPLGRLAFHFFSVTIPNEKGEETIIKTPVPREFLNLVKMNRA
ncbi:MAG: pseudouridine synthase [Flavobacteriales bacterium]|nr:pseudouridine synthase [Flavobacteriales bacterium]MDG1779905.1 pseudouridine synthase [Flavobacteriales bacterium]MDG2246061.1 pseudouridine synthase [Flavobacteriales bacterium]